MATPAHCYYCFECLAASYKHHEPISLAAVEELWEKYEQAQKLATLDKDELIPLRESDDEEDDDDEMDDDDEIDDGEQSGSLKPKGDQPQAIKLPSVIRLQSDSSSASTTPSIMSTNSFLSTPSSSTTVTTPRDQEFPLFVTWNTLSKNGHKSLRGCIGTFEAQELSEGLKSYALTSAFDDTRFAPIPEKLLPSLNCALTLLGTFEPCTDALDWIIGVHGIRISFIHHGRRYGATYLPDVAPEQGWTKEETLESLMRKAGWDGSTGSAAKRLLRGSSSASRSGTDKPWEQVSDFRVVKYQGLRASADYEEWQEWRQWVSSLKDGSAALLS